MNSLSSYTYLQVYTRKKEVNMKKILIKNTNLFDGTHPQLLENAAVIIEDSLVTDITQEPVSEEGFDEIIDAKGNTAIPGLTDAHVHVSITASQDRCRPDEIIVRSVRYAYDMLMRGFTTVRDAGGITHGLKKVIDEGYVDGPRIFPSNNFISQTCGHGDIRTTVAGERYPGGFYTSPAIMNRMTAIADGPAEMLKAVREQLLLGASQIKLMAGGGVTTMFDPIETLQFTLEEMKTAVDAAADYGTYVMAHIYTSAAMQRAAEAGIRSFEHATMMDDETGRIIADKGIWVMPGPQFERPRDAEHYTNPRAYEKYDMVRRYTAIQTEVINKYDLQIVYGTDSFGNPAGAEVNQLGDFHYYKEHYGSWRGLLAATGNVHELFKMSTYQNPYPEGKIGILEPDSFADILLVRGNPIEDLDILTDQANILFIMKNAKVYKNTL